MNMEDVLEQYAQKHKIQEMLEVAKGNFYGIDRASHHILSEYFEKKAFEKKLERLGLERK